MSKFSKKKLPKKANKVGQRVANAFPKVAEIVDKLNEAFYELQEQIEDDHLSTGALLVIEKGRPAVAVVGPDGNMSSESFSYLVEMIGDNGGGTFTESDMREIELWAEACEKAALDLRRDLAKIKKNPRKPIR